MYLNKMIQNIAPKALFHRSVVFRAHNTSAESNVNYTSELSFINEMYSLNIPTYRVLNRRYMQELPGIQELKMDSEFLVKMYTTMLSLNIMDTVLYECQRQGRISFYMTNFGEEAVQIGSAAALLRDDLVYAQYRESGILLWRGFHLLDLINQCYGNYKDKNKGRQMPVHYGSKEHHFLTISSPLTTQLPQAVGAAYGLKHVQKNSCVVCYFGEGAASEGDSHAAFNFAATLTCPVIFICRNNQYAISTPCYQQYIGDGIAARGPAYGINTIRVDGNDIIAMYHATKFARTYTIQEKKPVLIEAMTYRIGHHSTSDDSTVYRSNHEINIHKNKMPILQFRKYLELYNLWDQKKEENFINFYKKSVLDAITIAEKDGILSWTDLFSDVYYKMPNHIEKQMNVMKKHIIKYLNKYST